MVFQPLLFCVDFCNVVPETSLGIYGVYRQSEIRIRFCLTSPSKDSIIFLHQA